MRHWAGEVGASRYRIVLWRVRHADNWWATWGEREGVGRPLRHGVAHRRDGSQIGHHCDEVMVRKAAAEFDWHRGDQ
jgi:hypothetical protein